MSPRAENPSQLCTAAAHSLWTWPAHYQCIPVCVNLMAGSWHEYTRLHVVSSAQLAEGSCGHYAIACPRICAVLDDGAMFGGFLLEAGQLALI